MKQAASERAEFNIQKSLKPHRQLTSADYPSEEEIRKRYVRQERLKELGISNTTLDNDDLYLENRDDYEEDLDKLQASILIMQDKELPPELEQRIMEKRKKAICPPPVTNTTTATARI